jgi:hypothetical protein
MVRQWPEESDRRGEPPPEELMDAQFFVTLNLKPEKGSKTRTKAPYKPVTHSLRVRDNGTTSNRAHKYRDSYM